MLAGVVIDHLMGLAGHSDADVVTHAVIDALLGAAAMDDIGALFPDSDPANAGISSLRMLAEVNTRLLAAGWRIENIDVVVIGERPRLAPYREAMRGALAETLGIAAEAVAIKATTTEGMGFTGRGEGLAAQAVCLLERR